MNRQAHVVRVTRRFGASPERVFDAWLDPASARRWMFATPTGLMVRAEIDARVGGTFRFVDRRDGEDVEHLGTYLELDRPHRIVFAFSVPAYSPDADRVTVDIVPLATGCEVTLSHELRPEAAAYARRTEDGWRRMLDGLATTWRERPRAARGVSAPDPRGVVRDMNRLPRHGRPTAEQRAEAEELIVRATSAPRVRRGGAHRRSKGG